MSRSKRGGSGAPFGPRGSNDRVAVADARGGTQQHRHLPPLGNLEGGKQEIVGFLRIGRLEHRHAGGDGVTAVVLLVLAGRHAGIVGGNDHQSARDAGVGRGEQRVGGDVQADVFHRGDGARAGKGDAERHFQRDLFIGRPLAVPAQFGEAFQDFGGRRAGVTGAERHAGITRGQRNGFVAAQELSFG